MKIPFRRTVFFAFLVAVSQASFAADFYLKITDAKGESKIVTCPNSTCDIKDLAVGNYKIQQTDQAGNPVTTLLALDHQIKSPRDAASGLATGKRTHKPVSLLTADSSGVSNISITEANSTLSVQDHNSSRSNKTGSK